MPQSDTRIPTDLIITAPWLIPMDEPLETVREAAVAVKDGRIAAIGAADWSRRGRRAALHLLRHRILQRLRRRPCQLQPLRVHKVAQQPCGVGGGWGHASLAEDDVEVRPVQARRLEGLSERSEVRPTNR